MQTTGFAWTLVLPMTRRGTSDRSQPAQFCLFFSARDRAGSQRVEVKRAVCKVGPRLPRTLGPPHETSGTIVPKSIAEVADAEASSFLDFSFSCQNRSLLTQK